MKFVRQTDQPKEPKRTSIPNGPLRTFSGVRSLSQDGAEARRHCHPAHGRAVSKQVHAGVLCPSEACTTGRVHQVVRARDRCWAQDRLREVHQVQVCVVKSSCVSGCQPRAYRGKRRMRSSFCRRRKRSFLPRGLPPPGLPLNDFDHEDAEAQYEDDEPQNVAWQAVR